MTKLTTLKILLIVDHQVGLFDLARDFDSDLFYRNMIAHAAIGKLFDIPVIMTTSFQTGATYETMTCTICLAGHLS